MNPVYGRILSVMILAALCLSESYAQPRSAGISFSFGGIGVVYDTIIDKNTFASFDARVETAQLFSGYSPSSIPGFSASFTWNLIFARHVSRNGNEVRFFAGPGITAGYAEDFGRRKGIVCGLKGRVGGECTFDRKISISISVAPIIGAHLSKGIEMTEMNLYRSGIFNSLLPEIMIKYAF